MGAERGEVITWVESFYWVLTTMSTLGYGDFTFDEPVGQVFSMGVFANRSLLPLYDASIRLHGVPL